MTARDRPSPARQPQANQPVQLDEAPASERCDGGVASTSCEPAPSVGPNSADGEQCSSSQAREHGSACSPWIRAAKPCGVNRPGIAARLPFHVSRLPCSRSLTMSRRHPKRFVRGTHHREVETPVNRFVAESQPRRGRRRVAEPDRTAERHGVRLRRALGRTSSDHLRHVC